MCLSILSVWSMFRFLRDHLNLIVFLLFEVDLILTKKNDT